MSEVNRNVDFTEILNTPMPEGNDANAETVGDYLIALLSALWTNGSEFSGKRPFGNSGWKGDIEKALIMSNHVSGQFDEDGYIEEVDSETVHRLMEGAIRSLWKGDC